MEQIKTVELHIYVYKYTSEEEMNKHIVKKDMSKGGCGFYEKKLAVL